MVAQSNILFTDCVASKNQFNDFVCKIDMQKTSPLENGEVFT